MKYPYNKIEVTAVEIEIAQEIQDAPEGEWNEHYLLHIAGCIVENLVEGNAQNACSNHPEAMHAMTAENVAHHMNEYFDCETDLWEAVGQDDAPMRRRQVLDAAVFALENFYCGNFVALDAITHPLNFLRKHTAECDCCKGRGYVIR